MKLKYILQKIKGELVDWAIAIAISALVLALFLLGVYLVCGLLSFCWKLFTLEV
jgi:uncharacterized membrane protein (DUF485 family)